MKKYFIISLLLLQCMFMCTIVTAQVPFHNDEEITDGELKYLAMVVFNHSLLVYAKEEGIPKSKCILLTAPTSNVPPHPTIPLTSSELNKLRRDIIEDLNNVKNENIDLPQNQSAADALGNLALSYAIYSRISDNPTRITDLKKMNKLFQKWYLGAIERLSITGKDNEPMFLVDDRAEFQSLEMILKEHIKNVNLTKLKKYQLIKQNWQSVVMIVHKDLLKQQGNKTIIEATRLKQQKIDGIPVCADIPFGNQFAPYCQGTGFFINNTTIATAAHVFEEENLDCYDRDITNYRFITGVTLNSETLNQGIVVSNNNIYVPDATKLNSGTTIKKGMCQQGNYDWALVKVKPLMPSGSLPNFNMAISSMPQSDSTQVYTFGHGLGLPLKFSFDAQIWNSKDEDTPYLYYSELDMFGGNSGSPVFNAKTNQLIGIFIAGAEDFVQKNACMTYAEYNKGAYEIIQNIIPVSQALNDTHPTSANKVIKENPASSLGSSECSEGREMKVRPYAPMVYLNSNGAGKLTVCVLTSIPDSNKILERVSISKGAQTKIITYKLSPSNVKLSRYQADTVELNNTGDIEIIKIVIDALTATFKKSDADSSVMEIHIDTLTATFKKSDADSSTIEIHNKTCLQAPYIYLRRFSTEPAKFDPSIVIPVKGHDIIDELSKSNCIGYSYSIRLKAAPQISEVKYLAPSSANNARYKGVVNQNGDEFVATVEIEPQTTGGPIKKTKTTHEQSTADKKPRKHSRKRQ
jgi:V8-like Glu-specific endopeptidase